MTALSALLYLLLAAMDLAESKTQQYVQAIAKRERFIANVKAKPGYEAYVVAREKEARGKDCSPPRTPSAHGPKRQWERNCCAWRQSLRSFGILEGRTSALGGA